MSCLQVPAVAMQAWRRGLVSARRLGLRSASGHVDVDVVVQGRQLAGLRKEVRTCEYTDVHIMWEMLSKPSTSSKGAVAKVAAEATRRRARTGRKRKPAIFVVAAAWSRLTFYCCGII